ncbi:hypothetical protein [Aneurinibacillus sp. REN35]|uniref:hypothetical protein n=1 Tax=Aneurinibacillus sp. REN35 TaxID=3237286 RepID=UPI0035275ED5
MMAISGWLRKKLNLPVNLRIDIEMSPDEAMKQVVTCYEDLLHENLLIRSLRLLDDVNEGEQMKIGQHRVIVRIVNRP